MFDFLADPGAVLRTAATPLCYQIMYAEHDVSVRVVTALRLPHVATACWIVPRTYQVHEEDEAGPLEGNREGHLHIRGDNRFGSSSTAMLPESSQAGNILPCRRTALRVGRKGALVSLTPAGHCGPAASLCALTPVAATKC